MTRRGRAWTFVRTARHGPRPTTTVPLPSKFVLRLDDPRRRYVPRRLQVHTWDVDLLDAIGPQRYVPVDHRLVRVWLCAGSAVKPARGNHCSARPRGSYHGRRPLGPGHRDRTDGRDRRLRARRRPRGVRAWSSRPPNKHRCRAPSPSTWTSSPRRSRPNADPLDRCADLVVEDLPAFAQPQNPPVLDSAATARHGDAHRLRRQTSTAPPTSWPAPVSRRSCPTTSCSSPPRDLGGHVCPST